MGVFLSLTSVFVTWVVWSLLCAGIGLPVLRWLRVRCSQPEALMAAFWIGWALQLVFLQLWQLVYPVNLAAMALIVAASLGGWLVSWATLRSLAASRPAWPALAGISSVVLAWGLWLANRAMNSVAGITDAGLYHVGTVKWLTTYPIVPGLGNLHGRFAFNNSVFLGDALLEVAGWDQKSHHILNGLLFFVLGLQLCYLAWPIVRRPRVEVRPAGLLSLLLGGFVLYACLFVQTTSPDVTLYAVAIVVMLALTDLLLRSGVEADAGYKLFLILVLGAVGVTIKLSFAAFGAAAVTSALVGLLATHRLRQPDAGLRRALWGGLAVACVALGGWLIRNLFLSGYLIYPVGLFPLDVPWRIPLEQAVDEAKWIRSWALLPWVYHDRVLADNSWLVPWLHRSVEERFLFSLPLALTLAGVILVVVSRIRFRLSLFATVLLLAPLWVTLMFWFVSAPAVRFAGAFFWSLAACTFLLGVYRWPARPRIILTGLFLAVVAVAFVDQARTIGWIVQPGPDDGFYPLPSIETDVFVTDSGLQLNVPRDSYSCWVAPLPCTPYPMATLRLLSADDLGSGFARADHSPQIIWTGER